MSHDAAVDEPALRWLRRAPAEGVRSGGRLPRDMAQRFEGRPDLGALLIQENAQTLRLGLCVVAAVLVVACLIPIANARPRLRTREREQDAV